MKRTNLVVGAALLFAACGTAPPPVPELVLADVTVIDGLGSEPVPNQTIEVADGRILAIRPSKPEDVGTVDAAGMFVTPGLIDSHRHLPPGAPLERVEEILGLLLARGITSAREMACCAGDYAELVVTSDTSRLTRLYWSAYWGGPTLLRDDPRTLKVVAEVGSQPWLLAVTDTTDLEAAIRGAQASGVTGIKIYSDVAPDLVRGIAEAAKAAGLQVWSHPVIFPTRPSQVVASGVDVISHAAQFVWEGADTLPATYNGEHPFSPFGPPAPFETVAPDDPRVMAVLETMRDRGTILDPTVEVIARAVGEEAFEWGVALTRQAHAMGIPIAVGTDGSPFFDEIESLMQSVGLTPLEVIASATSVGAAAIGVEEDVGSVEVGKVADLVVYSADPSVDITRLRTPEFVVRGGWVVGSTPAGPNDSPSN